jgi:hypothetical protein
MLGADRGALPRRAHQGAVVGRKRSILVGTAVVLAALLAGCSGSGGGTAVATSSTASAPATVSTEESIGSDVQSGDDQNSIGNDAPEGGTAVNCKQLTKDVVQPLMAGTIDSVSVTAAGDDDAGQQCDFAGGTDDESDIDVLVLSGSAATTEYSDIASGGIAVPGVGDKAVRPDGDVSIDALHGDTYCSVSVGDPGDLPGIADFEAAHEGSSDIPDSVLDPAAAALGTLCNRIFGSGNTTPDLAALAAGLASAQTAVPSAVPTS